MNVMALNVYWKLEEPTFCLLSLSEKAPVSIGQQVVDE